MGKSTKNRADVFTKRGLTEPFPDFPLYPHPVGRWAKKSKGKLRYFSHWGRIVQGVMTPLPDNGGWEEAHKRYLAWLKNKEASAPSAPAPDEGGDKKKPLTVQWMLRDFLTLRKEKLKSSPRQYQEYEDTARRMVEVIDRYKLAEDISTADLTKLRSVLAERYGLVRLTNEIQKVRTILKWANGCKPRYIVELPSYDGVFDKPTKAEKREHDNARGEQTFTRDEILAMLEKADQPLKAMILLGINCAFIGADCAGLPFDKIDLDAGWHDYPRNKTKIKRRCWLWPETVSALRDALATRPEPKIIKSTDGTETAPAAGVFFVTKYGNRWSDEGRSHAIAQEFSKLRELIGMPAGRGFKQLRHTFRTVADATIDTNAVRKVMGHSDGRIDDNYTHGIADDRLRAVSQYVREWLYGAPAPKPTTATDAAANRHGKGHPPGPKKAKPGVSSPAASTLRLYVAEEGGAA